MVVAAGRERAGRGHGKGCGTRVAARRAGETLPHHSHAFHPAPCAGWQRGRETAAWALPRAAVGDELVTHEVQSGRGPRKGFLADTG